MISYPPKEVIETFGEHAAQGLEKWLGEVMKDTATKNDITEVKQDVAVLSTRVEHLEQSVDEIKTDVKDMRTEINERFDKMNERFDTMYHQTFTLIKWSVGLLGFFGTIISVMIFIGQFIKH